MTLLSRALAVVLPVLLAGAATAQDSRPANNPNAALGAFLKKARDAGAFKRVPTKQFFKGTGGTTILMTRCRTSHETIKTETVEIKTDGTWRGSRFTVGFDGRLQRVELGRGSLIPKQGSLKESVGTVENGVLTLKQKGVDPKLPGKQIKLEEPLLPFGMAFFVVPYLHDHLPKGGLKLHLFSQEDGMTPEMELLLEAGAEGGQRVIYQKGKLKIAADMTPAFKLTKLTATGEKPLEPITEEQADAKVKELIEKLQASEKKDRPRKVD